MNKYIWSLLALACSYLGAVAQQPTKGDSYEALVMRYYDYYEAQKPDSAELVLREALTRYPDKESNFVLHGNLAELLVARQDTLAAISELTEALRLQPEVTQLRSRRAELYEGVARYQDALLDLDQLIQQKPEWEIPLYNRARVRSELGLHNGAIHDLEQILKLNPEAYLPRIALAKEYQLSGDPLSAEKLLTHLIDKFPKIPNAYRALGWMLLEQDRKAEALDRVRHVIQELKVPTKEDYLLRGAIWSKYGEEKEAEADFERAKALGATDDEIKKVRQ